MKKWICAALIAALMVTAFAVLSWARGTRYIINWPKPYIGPVYVQVYDIRVNNPYTVLEKATVWVTWGKQTKAFFLGNRGSYTLKMYKHEYCRGPMILSGNVASFKIRYSMTPPWI